MNTSHGSSGDDRGHVACGVRTHVYVLTGVLGLLLTFAGGFVFYPTLVDLTRPLSLLSTTAVVFVLLASWIVVWSILEVAADRERTFSHRDGDRL